MVRGDNLAVFLEKVSTVNVLETLTTIGYVLMRFMIMNHTGGFSSEVNIKARFKFLVVPCDSSLVFDSLAQIKTTTKTSHMP